MHPTLNLQQLGIALAVEDFHPQTLTPEILQYSGIIESDWKLARQPICTREFSQVIFANGIAIVAQPQKVTFVEAIADKTVQEVLVPAMVRKYVATLPQINYLAIRINPSGYVVMDSQRDAARQYIAKTLLSPGAWQEVGKAPMRASINLTYPLERCDFNLTVEEAVLRQPDETTTPVVVFGGSFKYRMAANSGIEKQASIEQAIASWQVDLTTYTEIVNNKFLTAGNEPSVIPNVLAMSAKG